MPGRRKRRHDFAWKPNKYVNKLPTFKKTFTSQPLDLY